MNQVRSRRRVQKVGGAGNFIKPKNLREGDYLVGKFVDQSTDPKFGKERYVIEIEECEFAECKTHRGEEIVPGMKLTLNECGNLGNSMKEVSIGDVLEITYEGTEALPDKHTFAGTQCHQFSVGVCVDDDGSEAEEEVDL